MTALAGASSGRELIEGEPLAVAALSGGVESMGQLLSDVAASTRTVSTGVWNGRAAAVAETRLSELPPVLSEAGAAFAEVAAALDAWGEVLASAQNLADDAVEGFGLGCRLTGSWVADAPFGEFRSWDGAGDPGAGYRERAASELAHAERLVDEAASECASRLTAAANAGYRRVGWWNGFAHHGMEALRGVGDGVNALFELPPALFEAGAWMLDTTPANLGGRIDTVAGFVKGVGDDPVAFAEQVVDWDTLIENPDRWFGQVVPEALLGVVGGQVASASGYADDLADTIRRLHLDEAGAIGRPTSRPIVVSNIGSDSRLVREAIKAGRSAQRDLDALVAKLIAGNLSPGIRNNTISVHGVFELRTRGGARVYFRNVNGMIEIVAKSTKSNQARVIGILEELYG